MSGCRFSVSHQSYGPATSSELSSPIVSGLYGPDKKKTGTRIARNDKGKTYYVPADMTYHEWFDKYVLREVAENFRRKIAADGHEIIDQPTYNKLTKKFLRNGGVIIRGEEAEKHLQKVGAYASYIPGIEVAFIRDDARVSDVIEEMYHAKQNRSNMFGPLDEPLTLLKREIDAQKYLIKVKYKYKIPIKETNTTKQNLAYYEGLLRKKQRGE